MHSILTTLASHPVRATAVAVAAGVGLLVTEHALRRAGVEMRPSTLMTKVARGSEYVWGKAGVLAARITNLYDLLGLEGIEESAADLLKPVIQVTASPLKFVTGYVTQINEYTNPVVKVAVSTALATALALYAVPAEWQSLAATTLARHRPLVGFAAGSVVVAWGVRYWLWPASSAFTTIAPVASTTSTVTTATTAVAATNTE